jgi:hypothetical protein
MQQNHRAIFVDAKKYVGNPILGQWRSHFLEAAVQRSADGHPNRPAELDCFDVLANPLAVLIQRQTLQPISQRFSASAGLEENRLNSLTWFIGSPD